MSWNIIIILVFLGINAVFGLFRGWKNAFIRLITMAISLAVSVGLAVALQAWAGFELSATINNIIKPEALTGIIASITTIIPFADKIVPALNTLFFAGSCSVIVVLVIFLIVNKLGVLLYHILSGIGRTTEKVEIQQGKKKLKITNGIVSTIFGVIIGLLQGLLISAIFYAPICEIVALV